MFELRIADKIILPLRYVDVKPNSAKTFTLTYFGFVHDAELVSKLDTFLVTDAHNGVGYLTVLHKPMFEAWEVHNILMLENNWVGDGDLELVMNYEMAVPIVFSSLTNNNHISYQPTTES